MRTEIDVFPESSEEVMMNGSEEEVVNLFLAMWTFGKNFLRSFNGVGFRIFWWQRRRIHKITPNDVKLSEWLDVAVFGIGNSFAPVFAALNYEALDRAGGR